ncbi:MAG: glycogen/starch synthase [Candidatus Kuenenbacteria bacterium]
MSKSLNIVSISSEIDPFAKTGGLADVARSLPRALNRLSHTVICITPLYEKIIDKKKYNLKLIKEKVKIIIDEKNSAYVNYWKVELTKGLPVYFIENDKYFSRKKDLYGSSHENARFALFDLAVLKLLTILRFNADIIQCHDWHTGLIPYFLRRDFKDSSILKNAASVFTIHNLIFQLGHSWWEIPCEKRDGGKSKLPLLDSPKFERVNFAKRAILNSDMLNTVSETYAHEILEKEKGQELNILLKNRADRLFGIMNGIDHMDYNPQTDPGLKKNYSYKQTEHRKINKLFIQRKYGLTQNENIPLIIMASRITHQKGFELILETLEILLRFEVQMIIMGDGDKEYISQLKKLAKKYPKKLVWTKFNRKYETSLYAGGDMFLLPSTTEPCGINQMKALRYGCIPIVRSIGGLKDTVENFDFNNEQGNGFTFRTYSSLSLYGAIVRALEYYKNKKIWDGLVGRVMQISFSWNLPAQLYVKLFRKAMRIRKENGNHKQ